MDDNLTTLIHIAKIDLLEVKSQVETIKDKLFWGGGTSLDYERAYWTLEAVDQAIAHITTLSLKEETK